MYLDSFRGCLSKYNTGDTSNICNRFFFSDNPIFLSTFKWIGVIYLCYLAYDIYNTNPNNINTKEIKQKSFFLFLKMAL